MKIWKIVSGILSIVLFFAVTLQSCAAGAYNALTQNGEISGSAGFIVAILLLVGGIVSIAARGSNIRGNVAISILYGLAALIGISFSGSYKDLMLWSFWCLICTLVALGHLAFTVDNDQTAEPVKADAPKPVQVTMKTLMLEPDERRRNALIDRMPEAEAKSFLKQLLSALKRKPR